MNDDTRRPMALSSPVELQRAAMARFPWALYALAVAGAVLALLVRSQLLMTLLAQAVFSALLAAAVGTLIRLNGVVSFGHAAFFGLAAYTVALALRSAWMPVEIAIVLALVLPTALAFVLGLVIVRIPGVAFSMLTLGIGQALHEFAMKARDIAGGEDGLAVTLPPTIFGAPASVFQNPQTAFLIGWLALMVVLIGLSALSRSRWGRVVEAIRENEERARFVGYRTVVPRAAAFAMSACIAAMGGALFALYNGFVSPDILHWSLSGSALVMAIIGGPLLLWGPALGAVLLFLVKDMAGEITQHWQAIIGLTLIVTTVALPAGVGGAFAAIVARRRIAGR